MTLTQHNFPSVIDTSQQDMRHVLFNPALASSMKYYRGVGYFSSGWLSVVVEGLAMFAANGGQARVITSPILSETDLDAMLQGAEAKKDELLRNALITSIQTDLREMLARDTRAALSWLIADGILEFRLAVPQRKLTGEFHSKFGIFIDSENNAVSFEGSNNETISGTIRNYETLKVFCSWLPGHKAFVNSDIQRFERLWNNEDENIRTYDLPDAVRQAIIRIRDDEARRPYALPQRLTPQHKPLWSHQESAINAWETNYRTGIVSMATGSGKTRTALAAAERCANLALLIIAVPRSNLVTQWAGELAEHTSFPEPVLVFDASSKWQDKLFNLMRAAHRQNWDTPLVIIGTMRSLSGKRFRTLIEDAKMPQNTLLIVDEVHNIGAPRYRQILDEKIGWRLGLSATPARHFDEIGTAVINAYFQKTVFVYSMREALRDGRLTPYEYYVYAAQLSDDEYEEYQRLTQRIVMLRDQIDRQVSLQSNNRLDNDHRDIEMLLMRRARILKKTAAKREAIDQILHVFSLTKSLIYCADGEQLEDVQSVIQQHQIPYTIYIGETPQDERTAALEAVGKGRIPILLAIDCLDEGVDVPSVREAVIVASSSNKRQFIQRRGRVLRRSPDKDRAVLIDIIAIPPYNAGQEGKQMLTGELARAKEMAELAENSYAALLQVQEYTEPFGVMLTELLSGENDE